MTLSNKDIQYIRKNIKNGNRYPMENFKLKLEENTIKCKKINCNLHCRIHRTRRHTSASRGRCGSLEQWRGGGDCLVTYVGLTTGVVGVLNHAALWGQVLVRWTPLRKFQRDLKIVFFDWSFNFWRLDKHSLPN